MHSFVRGVSKVRGIGMFVALVALACDRGPFEPGVQLPPLGGDQKATPALTVKLQPETVQLRIGDSVVVTAEIRDSTGALVDTTVQWMSEAPYAVTTGDVTRRTVVLYGAKAGGDSITALVVRSTAQATLPIVVEGSGS